MRRGLTMRDGPTMRDGISMRDGPFSGAGHRGNEDRQHTAGMY